MRVVNNEQVLFIGWRYENPYLDAILAQLDISKEDAKKTLFGGGGQPALLKQINDGIRDFCMASGQPLFTIGELPKPEITHCFLQNTEKKEIASAAVVKHDKDPYDKDKARVFSLHKLLKTTYPGRENKPTRKLFWDAYLARK